jgi:ribosomal protein L40E
VEAAKPRTCYTHYFTYDALAGERLQGQWTSNYVINFYIMSESNYAKYKYCAQPGTTYVQLKMARSYSINWVVPENGTLYFVFENYASGSILSEGRTVSFELYTVGPQSSTSVLYSTTSAQLVLGTTVTLSSVHYSTVQTFPEGITSPTSLIIIGLVVGILIVIAVLTIAKRRKRTVAAKTEKPSKDGKEKRFCINCGAELQPGSKFCNKCGSTQN